jgi:hypothetical protein
LEEITDRLKEMELKAVPTVNSQKLLVFTNNWNNLRDEMALIHNKLVVFIAIWFEKSESNVSRSF